MMLVLPLKREFFDAIVLCQKDREPFRYRPLEFLIGQDQLARPNLLDVALLQSEFACSHPVIHRIQPKDDLAAHAGQNLLGKLRRTLRDQE